MNDISSLHGDPMAFGLDIDPVLLWVYRFSFSYLFSSIFFSFSFLIFSFSFLIFSFSSPLIFNNYIYSRFLTNPGPGTANTISRASSESSEQWLRILKVTAQMAKGFYYFLLINTNLIINFIKLILIYSKRCSCGNEISSSFGS